MALIATITRRLFIVLNILAAIAFLIACANRYINPGDWWYLALLGLFFPFMIVAHIVFVIGWLLAKSKWAALSLVVLIIGFTNISALFGTNFRSEFEIPRKDSSLRILSWNVHQFGFFEGYKKGLIVRQQMLDYLEEQNADILCFQEFIKDIPSSTKHVSIFELMENLGYPYSFCSEDYIQSRGRYTMGVAIFSRFPITDSFRIRYPGDTSNMSAESLLAADILYQGKPIRVFTTHLQSNRVAKSEYTTLISRRVVRDGGLGTSKSVIKKLKVAYTYRSQQADKVAAALDASPYPEILAGDFNDIPNSYTYFRLRENRLDAFQEKGWGLGRTFSHISPTLRIDYIMADKRFEVLQYKRNLMPYSDHYPIIADLMLKGR
jgi:endonuclease/exonuclease/phosphatase family metal-dependent hydrolase